MALRRNVIACNGPQSHHQDPKISFKKYKLKTMLITFFDKQGVNHKEFLPEGQAVNCAFYVEFIGKFLKRIS
jgi:hypothetical protein